MRKWPLDWEPWLREACLGLSGLRMFVSRGERKLVDCEKRILTEGWNVAWGEVEYERRKTRETSLELEKGK